MWLVARIIRPGAVEGNKTGGARGRLARALNTATRPVYTPPNTTLSQGAVCLGQTQGDQPMRASSLHLQRSTEALLGYLRGITCDDHLSDLEIANLQGWIDTHDALRQYWPFDELTARLESILRDSVIDEDERAELLEWCADLSLDTNPAYNLFDMATRQLHGVLHGIQSDGKVTEDEVYGLRDWLSTK